MEEVSSDANGSTSTDIHLKKKQRREDKTRSAIVDFDSLDCPLCSEPLASPVFQCENGHWTCFVCCPKLSNKCPTCESPIGHIRCRGIESVLQSIFVSCSNEASGCNEKIPYGDISNHEKDCVFSPFSCPIQDCEFTTSYNDIYDHCYVSHFDGYIRRGFNFRFGVYFNVLTKSGDIKIIMEDKKKLLFAVQRFSEPYGVYVTVSVIAPTSLDIGKFSFHLSYSVDEQCLTYKSSEVRRIQEVSLETPQDNFMLIPSNLLCGGLLKLMIRDLNQDQSKKVGVK